LLCGNFAVEEKFKRKYASAFYALIVKFQLAQNAIVILIKDVYSKIQEV